MSASSPSYEDDGLKVSLCVPMQQMKKDFSSRMLETEDLRGAFKEAKELKESISKKTRDGCRRPLFIQIGFCWSQRINFDDTGPLRNLI
mmetsp:Transcript_24510/g.41155  ORF Transcript_24510/g.41155 Transcript_24510/m.41155 type:complete len:89 (+) Transcript_24510:136-402(+)